MRKCAVEQGLADLEVEFHVVTSKMHPEPVSRQIAGLRFVFPMHCSAISFSNDHSSFRQMVKLRLSTSGWLAGPVTPDSKFDSHFLCSATIVLKHLIVHDKLLILLRYHCLKPLGRWDVASTTSMKTCVYKPNAVSENPDLKKAFFGGLFSSNYHKVPRNGVCSLTWEAGSLLPNFNADVLMLRMIFCCASSVLFACRFK